MKNLDLPIVIYRLSLGACVAIHRHIYRMPTIELDLAVLYKMYRPVDGAWLNRLAYRLEDLYK